MTRTSSYFEITWCGNHYHITEHRPDFTARLVHCDRRGQAHAYWPKHIADHRSLDDAERALAMLVLAGERPL